MLTEEDYQLIATTLAIPIATAKAVSSVESGGVTHWSNGLVPILFEALYFHNKTGGKYDGSHPDISSPFWDQSLYRYGPEEYNRLDKAEALDKEAAYESTSWGAFQVMGANWKDLGYASVFELVTDVQTDAGQMDSFIRYVQHNKLENALRTQNWRAFAEAYNGEANVEAYSAKIEVAYEHYANGMLQMGDTGDDVKAIQSALQKLSFLTGSVDGIFGKATRMAVSGFQRSKGLVADGVAGPLTRDALNKALSQL